MWMHEENTNFAQSVKSNQSLIFFFLFYSDFSDQHKVLSYFTTALVILYFQVANVLYTTQR